MLNGRYSAVADRSFIGCSRVAAPIKRRAGQTVTKVSIRNSLSNILIGGGAYYLSWWIEEPLAFVYGKLVFGHVTYRGGFASRVVLPIVLHVPPAIAAAVVGACVVILVDSKRPLYWTILPAGLYAWFGSLGYSSFGSTVASDRLPQVIGALFPAVACLIGALLAVRRQSTLRRSKRSDKSPV